MSEDENVVDLHEYPELLLRAQGFYVASIEIEPSARVLKTTRVKRAEAKVYYFSLERDDGILQCIYFSSRPFVVEETWFDLNTKKTVKVVEHPAEKIGGEWL